MWIRKCNSIHAEDLNVHSIRTVYIHTVNSLFIVFVVLITKTFFFFLFLIFYDLSDLIGKSWVFTLGKECLVISQVGRFKYIRTICFLFIPDNRQADRCQETAGVLANLWLPTCSVWRRRDDRRHRHPTSAWHVAGFAYRRLHSHTQLWIQQCHRLVSPLYIVCLLVCLFVCLTSLTNNSN